MIAHWDEVESGGAGAGHHAHGFRAGADGMTFLADGTRRADDVCCHPRSDTICVRGLGPIGRLEDLAYDDAEPR